MSTWVHLTSPVCGVAGTQLHGVRRATRDPKIKRKTHDAACGKRVHLLGHAVLGEPGSLITAQWPPYATDAREWGYERCQDCMKALPGKPIRPQFVDATTDDGGAA